MVEEENESKIKNLLTRGVSAVYPSIENFKARLKSGAKLRVYLGIDPTGPTLHLGHSITLLKLREFQDLGHEVIVLYGGFTTQIGDPTDKMAARQPLFPDQIKKNLSGYKKLIGKILDLKKANIRFLNNEKWTNKLKPVDLINIASQFTVSQLLERDMFQERIKSGKEIHLHEFLYPLFQAYDAVTMDVDVQIGGNDQIFNMLAGRTLMRKLKNKDQLVLATRLLVDQSGKKMGKTEGNMISLSDEADQMFGKIMSWSDAMIIPGLELCTRISNEEIEALKAKLEDGMNPRDAKLILAEEVVSIYYGRKKAKEVRENFLATFSKKELSSDLAEVIVKKGEMLSDVLLKAKLVLSKSDFNRLVSSGAVREFPGGKKITDQKAIVSDSTVLKVGKHRFIKIITD